MTITEVTPKPADAERFSHILQVHRAAYLRDGTPSSAARRSDLNNLKAALIARRSAIEKAINTDFGHRSRHETAMMELVGVVQGIDYLERNLRRFMRPTRRRIAMPLRFGTNRVEYQPLGVVGGISPWNYPVNLSLMPVVTAIAAGNRVMLKPSKLTPATNAVLASMASPPTTPFVHESEIDTFIDSYDRRVKAAYPDGPTSNDYTSIVNDKQYSILRT